MESNVFLVGKRKWKLWLTHECGGACLAEKLEISLCSCNPQFETAHVGISVHSQKEALRKQKENDISIERKLKTACPFGIIDRCDIPFQQKPDSAKDSLLNEELIVTIDLKDIEKANYEERQKSGNEEIAIDLEIINRRSIKAALNTHVLQGIDTPEVPPEEKRNIRVHGHSSVRLWSENFPDRRYWLVEQSASGDIAIKKCLNSFNPFLSFLKLCEGRNDSIPMITLFEEEETPDQAFQPVDDSTFMVFGKLSELQFSDPSFIGYLLPQKTMTVQDLLQKFAEMADLDSRKYKAYLEQGNLSIKDITGMQTPLNESGIHSGACIILRKVASNDLDAAKQTPVGDAGNLDVHRHRALSLEYQTAVAEDFCEQVPSGEHIKLREKMEGSSASDVNADPLYSASADSQRSLHPNQKESLFDAMNHLASESPEFFKVVERFIRCMRHASHCSCRCHAEATE